MPDIVGWIDRSWYADYGRNWDDLMFRTRILQHLTPDAVVLDLGSGAGILEQVNFRGLVARVCGVDLDTRVVDNPMLDEGRIADAANIPYCDALFDVVFADNVLEHLVSPLKVFKEVIRVLKPGGTFLFKTPNKWHYIPTIARLTPHLFHQFVNRLRGRTEVDTFPTHYLANTRMDLIQLSADSGFVVERIYQIEGRPEYLRMTWPTYLIGAAYERLVNSTELLSPFRVLLIGQLRKP